MLHHIHVQSGLRIHLTRHLLYKVPRPIKPAEDEGGSDVLQGLHNWGLAPPPVLHREAESEPLPDRPSPTLLSTPHRKATLPRRRPPPPPRCSSLDRHSGQLEAEEGAKSQDTSSRPQSQLSQTHKVKPCQSELSSPAHTQRTGGGGGGSHSQKWMQAGSGDQISRQQGSTGGGVVVATHYSSPSNNSLVPPSNSIVSPSRPFPSIRQNGQSKFHFPESSS